MTASAVSMVTAAANAGFSIISSLMFQTTAIVTIGLAAAAMFGHRSAVFRSLVLKSTIVAVFLAFALTMADTVLELPGVHVVVTGEKLGIEREFTDRDLTTRIMGTSEVSDGDVSWLTEVYYRCGRGTRETAADIGITYFRGLWDGSVSRKGALYLALVIAWTWSSILMLLRLGVEMYSVREVLDDADDPPRRVLDETMKMARRIGVEPPVVLQSCWVKSPFLTGLFSPVILLPRDMTDLRDVLAHELGHLKRHDCLWNFLAHLTCALMPLQPLLRILNRETELASDYVCDDYAVSYSGTSQSYAENLVSLAERFRPNRWKQAYGVGIVSHKSLLFRRVKRIMEESRAMMLKTPDSLILASIMATMLVGGAAGFVGLRSVLPDDGGRQAIRAARQTSPVSVLAAIFPESDADASTVQDAAGRTDALGEDNLRIGEDKGAINKMRNTGPGIVYHGVASPFGVMEMLPVERVGTVEFEQIIVEVTREEPFMRTQKSEPYRLPPGRMDESLRNQLATTAEFSNPLINRPPWERTNRVFSWEIDLADKN